MGGLCILVPMNKFFTLFKVFKSRNKVEQATNGAADIAVSGYPDVMEAMAAHDLVIELLLPNRYPKHGFKYSELPGGSLSFTIEALAVYYVDVLGGESEEDLKLLRNAIPHLCFSGPDREVEAHWYRCAIRSEIVHGDTNYNRCPYQDSRSSAFSGLISGLYNDQALVGISYFLQFIDTLKHERKGQND